MILHIIFTYNFNCQDSIHQALNNPEIYKLKIANMIKEIDTDFTQYWIYKDLYNTASQLGANRNLVQRSFSHLGDEIRLKQLLVRAMQGENVELIVIGGSISRGAPFAENGQGFRIYFNAVRHWWNHVIAPITGSNMHATSISIGGVGTDYFSYCLNAHAHEDESAKLFLWELAANDRGRYDDKPFPPGKPLEQLTRNIIHRKSRSPLLFVNFFRGHDYQEGHCANYEDEGGLTVANHYRITSISWRNFVCKNINPSDPIFSMRKLFSEDLLHPGILGHAQMAFLLINYVKNSFLRMLRNHASKVASFAEFHTQSQGEMNVAKILYHETSSNKPMCATFFKYNEFEPNNTLPIVVTRHDDFHYNIFKQFKVRADKLGGLQTFISEQLLQLSFSLPKQYSRLVLTTHSDTGNAQVWFDKDTPVILETDNYHMGTKVELITTNLPLGDHDLNVLSMKGGFAVCAIAVI